MCAAEEGEQPQVPPTRPVGEGEEGYGWGV